MKHSFKIITKKSGLALAAAIAVFSVGSPAFAQSYTFPTYAYLHSGTTLRAGLYDAAAVTNTPKAVDPNAWGSTTGRQNSR